MSSCPVNFVSVDEHRVRVQAFFISIFAGCFLISSNGIFLIALVYDFAVRVFITPKISFIFWFADSVLKVLPLQPKPIDSAAKVVAAKIGLFFSCSGLLLNLLNYPLSAHYIVSMLLMAALMEAVLNFCVGCKVYQGINRYR